MNPTEGKEEEDKLSSIVSRPSLPSAKDEFFTLSRTTKEGSSSNVSDDGASSESSEQFLILSEDHFTELAEVDLDSQGLPIDKIDVERAIRRYIKLIRLEDSPDQDPDKKKKLIVRLCQLRIRLNQMNEELEEKYLNGHRLNRPGGGSVSGSVTDLSPGVSPTQSSLVCDVCLKKQNMIFLPPGLFKTYQPNVVLVCDFCDFKIHLHCISYPMELHVRRCPQVLFQEEEEAEQQEQQQRGMHSQESRETNLDSPSSADITFGRGINSSFNSNIRYSRYIEFSICPEVGLSKQGFKCADCQSPVLLSSSRLDDYDGLYYCFRCHWNDFEKTPARILHNWDSTPKPVSRRSLQMICYIKRKPVLFDVLNFNPMLYGLVEDLPHIKRLRLELSQMTQYIRLCRQPGKPKITCASYFFNEDESNGGNALSFSDLLNLESIKKHLFQLHGQLLTHITTDCEGCRGKGFYCDHCRDRTDLLFPFSLNISSCPECGTVYHRSCYHRKGKSCIKCQRRLEKMSKSQMHSQETDREEEDKGNEIASSTTTSSSSSVREDSSSQYEDARELIESKDYKS